MAIALLVLCSFSAALADQVVLENGDVLQGKLQGLQDGIVKLETPFAGEVPLKWEAVRWITSDNPREVKLSGGERLIGRLVAPGEALGTDEGVDEPAPGAPRVPAVLFLATDEGILRIPAARVREIGTAKEIIGYVDLGYAYSTGNSDGASSVAGRAGIAYVGERTLAFADGMWAAGPETGSTEGRREGIFEGLAARRLGGPIYGAVNLEALTDMNRDIRVRIATGGGVALRMDLGGGAVGLIDVGPEYVFDREEDRKHSNELALRVGARAAREIVGRLSLEGRGVIYLAKHKEIHARIQGGPRYQIWRGLYGTLRALYEYDRSPADGVGPHDAAFEAAIGWAF